MVYITIEENDLFVTLNCHKGRKNGDFFRLVINAETKEVVERPINPDIDVSIAYSHVYMLLKSGQPLPKETVAAWG